MEGNFIILNIIILYVVPGIVTGIGIAISKAADRSVNKFIGIIIVLAGVITCGILAFYALKNELIFTGILGFVIAGMFLYAGFKDELNSDKE